MLITVIVISYNYVPGPVDERVQNIGYGVVK